MIPPASVLSQQLTSAEVTFIQGLAGLSYVQGDILYHNGSVVTNLGFGTSGQFLKTQGSGANPIWATGAGDLLADGTVPLTANWDVGAFDITAANLIADGDTAAGDLANMGYNSTEGLILTGQGSTFDVSIKNDTDALVLGIETGTTIVRVASELKFVERADHESTPGAGFGYLWVKSDTPSSLIYTDDAGADTDLTNILVVDVGIQNISTAAYTTLKDYINTAGSTGLISGGVISDGGSGTVDITASEVYIKSSDSNVGELFSAEAAAVTGQALTDNSLNFIYVDYNSGAPQVVVSATPLADVHRNVVLGVVYRASSVVNISNVNITSPQMNQLLSKRLAFVDGLTRQSGSVTSEVGTRQIAVTAGAWWLALIEISSAALDTSDTGTFSYWHQNGGTWTEVTSQDTIDNTQYNDTSSGLATLSNNKYGVHWVYLDVEEDDYHVVYGVGDYTLTAAEDALAPSVLPPHFSGFHTSLIAKIIIVKSASSFTSLQNPFDVQFGQSVATNHDDLGNLGWTASGHTGTATRIAAFNGSGAATEYTLSGTGTELPTTAAPTFATLTVGTGDLTIGATSANDVQPSLKIIGDADSDAGGDTDDTLTLKLTANATPTLATWDFTSTQGAGYKFDKSVTMTGGGTLGVDNTITSLILTEKASIALDPAGGADGDYSGITITGLGGDTIAFGDLIYLQASDSRWELVDADAVATAGDLLIGMAVTASTDGNALTILLIGQIRADANFPALTIGSAVYASTTPGNIVVADPTGADDVVRVVGFALTADEIYFNPSQDHITVTG